MNEPSVLDFVKAKLMPWKYKINYVDIEKVSMSIDAPLTEDIDMQNVIISEDYSEKKDVYRFNLRTLSTRPWYFPLAILFALLGQILLEPPNQKIALAIIFYSLSGILMLFSALKNDPIYCRFPEPVEKEHDSNLFKYSNFTIFLSFLFLLVAFFAFKVTGTNDIRFNAINLFFWAGSLFLFCISLIEKTEIKIFTDRVNEVINEKKLLITISPWRVFVVLIFIVVLFFRFFRLDMILGEMFSDHAEKLLDVYDVLNGNFHVFFERNTGREFFQFYLTAMVAWIFKTGISFMSLKIGTALAGFFTLPYIYKLGKEIGNRWVGLIAFFLAGISYWPNLISRVGLRFPLYPLFAAPALFYLIRGLRQKRRTDFIYSGIALGLGLHGYSPMRFLPFVILIGVILYLLHSRKKGTQLNTLFGLTIIVITAFIVFLPLFKYTLINPEAVSYRALTRLGSAERELSEPVFNIFVNNLWQAETMFFYSNGNTWVHSIPFRPALDFVSAAFYFIGTLFVFFRYFKLRNWEDLYLLLSVPLLMMPSILSLAFPEENPSLNRTGGAIIPVFIIAAIGFEGVFSRLIHSMRSKLNRFGIISFAIVLLIISSINNYDLVFNQFNEQFLRNAWNTTQIGSVIKGFSDSVGNADNAFVVPTAHWVDTRLVGIVAGYPTRDFALWPDQFYDTLLIEDQKLFILKPENTNALKLLEEMYPDHSLYRYDSGREGKDFLIFSIPALVAPSN